mmetsp:Transcript_46919/g.111706  ORF Transcript_46919/g.111706 Transcript_46919/m.111706 type:complete len:208 (-) Transcript_46919:2992-3615(-)
MRREHEVVLPRGIQLRVRAQHIRLDVAVEDREKHAGRRREDHRIQRLVTVVVERLGGEGVVESVPQESERHDVRLVEEVANHCPDSVVVPSPVDQQQPFQIGEAREGIVRGQHGLLPLFPPDPDTHVCRLDHRDIVCPVADGERHLVVHVLLDQEQHLGLLRGGDARAEHRLAAQPHLQEVQPQVRLHRRAEARAVDDQRPAPRPLD